MANAQVKLAKKLIRIAHNNPSKQAELVPKIQQLLGKQAADKKIQLTFLKHTDVPVKGEKDKDFFKKGEGIRGEILSETSSSYTIKGAHDRVYTVPKKSVKKAALAKVTSKQALKKAFSKLSRQERWDLNEALALASEGSKEAAPAPAVGITKMPGFAPMQLRQQIDRLGTVRQELELMAAQYEAVLKKMKGLEKEEKAGLALLKKAASEMRDKGKYVVEAETAMIQFTAYLTDKRPGIEQMIAVPEDSKWGDKAGDFFGRVSAKFGNEVSEAVESIYQATKEDLTHSTMAVRGLKLVGKTASLDASTLRTAGIMDMVVDVKEWISGKATSLFKFMGDIGRWVKGFVERTKLVGKKKDGLKKAVSSAKSQVDKLLAGAL